MEQQGLSPTGPKSAAEEHIRASAHPYGVSGGMFYNLIQQVFNEYIYICLALYHALWEIQIRDQRSYLDSLLQIY